MAHFHSGLNQVKCFMDKASRAKTKVGRQPPPLLLSAPSYAESKPLYLYQVRYQKDFLATLAKTNHEHYLQAQDDQELALQAMLNYPEQYPLLSGRLQACWNVFYTAFVKRPETLALVTPEIAKALKLKDDFYVDAIKPHSGMYASLPEKFRSKPKLALADATHHGITWRSWPADLQQNVIFLKDIRKLRVKMWGGSPAINRDEVIEWIDGAICRQEGLVLQKSVKNNIKAKPRFKAL